MNHWEVKLQVKSNSEENLLVPTQNSNKKRAKLRENPLRILVHCVVKYSRPPDLKSSSNVSLPFASITEPTTDPRMWVLFMPQLSLVAEVYYLLLFRELQSPLTSRILKAQMKISSIKKYLHIIIYELIEIFLRIPTG